MMAAARPNLYSIAPGASFLRVLGEELLAGRLTGPVMLDDDPLALARTTVFLPTRRAARAFSEELANLLKGRPVLLPRIVPLGDLDEAEAAMFSAEEESALLGEALLPAIDPRERLLLLTSFVLSWSRKLGEAVIRPEPGDALLVADTPADALALAADLATLLDSLAIHGRSVADLVKLRPENFDEYWQITLQFLSIAMEQWPNLLAKIEKMDVAVHRDLMIRRRAAQFRTQGSAGPVVAAGSTGSMPATADLLAAIARLPNGAVVLPGLDFDLDEDSVLAIVGNARLGESPAVTHPQALLHRLLAYIGATRADVVELGQETPPLRHRRAVFSQAMRPPTTTEHWSAWRRSRDETALAQGLADLAVVEARDEREEALVIALALRRAILEPGKIAALVTPDRDLAERVAASLGRWGIEVDDSAGQTLARMPAGILARLAATAAAQRLEAKALVDLLAHPLADFGRERASVRKAAAILEIGVLRGSLALPNDLAELRAALAAARIADHAKSPRPGERYGDEDWIIAEDLIDRIAKAFEPFAAAPDDLIPLPTIAMMHRQAVARICSQRSEEPEWVQLDRIFDDLTESPERLRLRLAEYPAFFANLAERISVHPPRRTHPRLHIWGLLEARLLRADLMVLGGLVEKSWPPAIRTDAFLNRAMRAELGLSPPEQRIGQSAHDFVSAAAAERVVLTYAKKTGGTPNVPSRFLQRLEASIGAENPAWLRSRAAGDALLDLARKLDAAPPQAAAIRPRPKAPSRLHPQGLSVTEVETLVRDPYAIFARKILRLVPHEPLQPQADARIFGILLHDILEKTSHRLVEGGDEEAIFTAVAHEALAKLGVSARQQVFIKSRLAACARSFAIFQKQEHADHTRIATEVMGSLDVQIAPGAPFQLTAKADRISERRNGDVVITDFKTGTVPKIRDVQSGFFPQLTLEAAMLRKGAFAPAAPLGPLADLRYVKFAKDGDAPDISSCEEEIKNFDAQALGEAHLSGLTKFLAALRAGEHGFVARRVDRLIREGDPYGHLARAAEWSRGSGEA